MFTNKKNSLHLKINVVIYILPVVTNGRRIMRKGITKEQVVETTLKLIKDSENIRSVNLRGVAREIGCAHTNLYNYFSSFDELLWCAHIRILEIFLEEFRGKDS